MKGRITNYEKEGKILAKYNVEKIDIYETIEKITKELFLGNRVYTLVLKEINNNHFNDSKLKLNEEYEIIGPDYYVTYNILLVNKKDYDEVMKGNDEKSIRLRRIYNGIRNG